MHKRGLREKNMKKYTAKRQGLGLEMKTFTGKSGPTYIVLRSTKAVNDALAEVEAKRAALDCGGQSA